MIIDMIYGWIDRQMDMDGLDRMDVQSRLMDELNIWIDGLNIWMD